tara:strand:- start:851 stop:1666 length:816 start_codon:yes stop_codon:yes gene_type:complete
MKIQSGFANAKGAKLYFEVTGSGSPITLIQGSLLDRRMWDSQFSEFAKHYQVIRYDVRGYGKSIPDNIHEKYCHHEDLLAVIKHIGLKSTHVLGLSMGGTIAIDFAVMHPEKTISLIPVSCGPGGYQEPIDPNQEKDPQPKGKRTVDVFKESGLDAAKTHVFNVFKPGIENPDLLKQIIDEYSGSQLIHPEIEENEMQIEPSASNRLSELKIPTLIIVGEQDGRGIHSSAMMMEKEIRTARKVVMKNVGHLCSMQNSAEFNQIVLDFLSQV